MANITLQTIESLPLVEEVNENTSLVGWDGTQTVRVPNVVTFNPEDQAAGLVNVDEHGVLQPSASGGGDSAGTLTFDLWNGNPYDQDNPELIVSSMTYDELLEAMFQLNGLKLGSWTYNAGGSISTANITLLGIVDGGIIVSYYDHVGGDQRSVYFLEDGTFTFSNPGGYIPV